MNIVCFVVVVFAVAYCALSSVFQSLILTREREREREFCRNSYLRSTSFCLFVDLSGVEFSSFCLSPMQSLRIEALRGQLCLIAVSLQIERGVCVWGGRGTTCNYSWVFITNHVTRILPIFRFLHKILCKKSICLNLYHGFINQAF